jgi:hypothetical protein
VNHLSELHRYFQVQEVPVTNCLSSLPCYPPFKGSNPQPYTISKVVPVPISVPCAWHPGIAPCLGMAPVPNFLPTHMEGASISASEILHPRLTPQPRLQPYWQIVGQGDAGVLWHPQGKTSPAPFLGRPAESPRRGGTNSVAPQGPVLSLPVSLPLPVPSFLSVPWGKVT